jgi:hypothetical protein
VSGITSKFRIVAVFVIVDLQKILHTECLCMLIYLYTKFHIPSFSGSLLIAIKLRVKYMPKLYIDAMLCYILQSIQKQK